ncbi:MAG: GNAT family N-acetyltransferase [Pseudomonadota bacterium]
MTPTLRRYRATDATALGRILYRAVQEGAAAAYDAVERAAWAPRAPDGAEWALRLAGQVTLVADIGGKPCGFMTMATETGYIDLAFVAPEVMGQGVGHALYREIEAVARDAGCPQVCTHASRVARPFFERQGWTVLHQEEVARGGVMLARFEMKKVLGCAPGATSPAANASL